MTQEQNIDSNSRKLLECLRLLPGKRLEIDTKRDEILRTRVEILGDKLMNEMCCECEYNVEEGNTVSSLNR